MYSRADFDGLNDDIMDNLDLTGVEESGVDAIWSELKKRFPVSSLQVHPTQNGKLQEVSPVDV